MKSPLYSVFIVASLVVAIAHCFPGGLRQNGDSSDDNGGDGADTILVLPRNRNLFEFPQPVFQLPDLDDDEDGSISSSIGGYNPFASDYNPLRSNPLDGFIERVHDALNRMTERISDVLSGIPDQIPVSFSPWGKIPDGANTTSTTKVIDGHIVTVNETIYSSGDNNSNAVFRVRIVDVKPLNQTENSDDTTEVDIGGGEEAETVTTGSTESTDKQGDNEETTTQARSVETVEDFAGNEIPKNQVDTLTA